MTNGITYVTPDPCPHCGGRVSTGIAGDEDSEKYMYVCGQCDTWFEQKGYPTTSKRYVTEESEVDSLRARVAGLEAWQKEVANGLGYLNQPEGQAGYEVAAPRVIIHDWHEAEAFQERYREALERIRDRDVLFDESMSEIAAEALKN